MKLRISRSRRLLAAIGISCAFFLTEISIGFYTHSLALVADAFHYLNDIVGFVVAFAALKVSKDVTPPQGFSFGWQRAQVLGAFFNGSILFALGISIALQSIERFITLHHVENPKLMLIIGSIGLGLNIICAAFLHEHHHDHHGHSCGSASEVESPTRTSAEIKQHTDAERGAKHHNHKHLTHEAVPVSGGQDLGMMGVMLHVLGDAANNLAVMVAALVIWLTRYEERYYADPATSLAIAVIIVLSSLSLIRQSGLILLESAPNALELADVKHDLEQIPGILAAHELHIWRLSQHKVLASVHVAILNDSASRFPELATTIQECFHAYGIHSVTVQPEIVSPGQCVQAISLADNLGDTDEPEMREKHLELCRFECSSICKDFSCCG